MADVRMPTTHWLARITILLVLVAVVFAAAFTGALTNAASWATDCGGRITLYLWSPLLGDQDQNNPRRPVSGCLGDDRT